MGAVVAFSEIGVAGCIGFLTLGRLRSSRYTVVLGIVFGALFVFMVVVYAGGYVECERRGNCPPGLTLVKAVYFGLLARAREYYSRGVLSGCRSLRSFGKLPTIVAVRKAR